MLVWLLFTLLIVSISYIYIVFVKHSKRKLPEGAREAPIEKGWPILGILPIIENPMYDYFMKLGQKHGSLFRIRFGMRDIFVLNDYEVIKKCLKDDGDNFSGRWRGKLNEAIDKNSGVIIVDGEHWAKHRSFILKVLRDFGLGKSKMIEIVQEECRHLLAEIRESGDKSQNFGDLIPLYTVNIITQFLMSKRYEHKDEDFQFIIDTMEKFSKQRNMTLLFHLIFPEWDKSIVLTKISYFLSFQKKAFERIYEVFRKEIRNHMKSIDVRSGGGDLMDRYLIERSQIVERTGAEQSFTEFQLIRSSFEVFVAGFETTSTTLEWSLLFLAQHQEIQKNMHDEIVNLVGPDRMISTSEKKTLPLTQAIMDEIMRLGSIVPLSVIHRNFKDTIVDGIFIKKNSLIFPNLYACHRDPKVWKKPFEFYPEHFLIKDNDGALIYNPREELIPFSLGKRQCLGESLARAEYFIFLSSIIQRFQVRYANSVSEKDYQEALKGVDGNIRSSNIKHFIFEKYN